MASNKPTITEKKNVEVKSPLMTNENGAPAGAQVSLTVGPRGPVLMEDYPLLETLQHFNRENIPARVMHAKGAGAYGTFTVTADMSRICCARVFDRVGTRTELFARFSCASGEQGSSDAERDIRGFAIKFYTEAGNWDLVGSNSPTYFIRDPYKLPMLVHARGCNPQTSLRDPDMLWDFMSLSPETMLQLTYLYSDDGIPADYRHMNGYSGHTFALFNAKGDLTWCKFQFETLQGLKTLNDETAVRVCGEDPDHARRDLFNAIARKEFPKWRMSMQCMTEEQSMMSSTNPFDITKTWSIKEYPLIEIGTLELNRNPLNAFAEVEQSVFRPSSFVRGIGPSPDKMLQARLASYADAQHYRVGVNALQIPVNKPRCPVMNYLRGGSMNIGAAGSSPNYWPNSLAGTPKPIAAAAESEWKIGKTLINRFDGCEDHDDYSLAGELFRSFDGAQRERMARRIARSLALARLEVQMRQLTNFFRADEEYCTRVAKNLGVDASAVIESGHREHALVNTH